MKLEYDDEITPVVRTIVQREEGNILVLRKQELKKREYLSEGIDYITIELSDPSILDRT